ncbi:MAG: SWIM zinc finger family protein [Planctomycetes bacterium]|nr:SWIM zinc finger family protein [Planctomycetota bacterium]
MAWWGGGGYWPEYVPVATRIARAKKAAEKLRKKGVEIQPVELAGKKIASSFWGKGWCDHMDSFHDYENRLPRGRSYVRNGSVVHLDVSKGKITAMVAGTEVYRVEIKVELFPKTCWDWIKDQCAGRISSLMDLLKGRLSDGVMQVVANRDKGLFPGPREIKMRCSCPDIADMCKHIAAVFYGIGARLDSRPELLFLLRGVDHADLATGGGVDAVIDKGRGAEGELAGADLAEVFGIELAETGASGAEPAKIASGDVLRVPDAKNRRGRPRKSAGKSAVADTPGAAKAAAKAGTPPKTARKSKLGTGSLQKKTAAEAKPQASKPKAGKVAMSRQSAGAARAAGKAGTPPKAARKSKLGTSGPQKKTAAETKPQASKPKAGNAMLRQSAAAAKAAAKAGTPPKTARKSKLGTGGPQKKTAAEAKPQASKPSKPKARNAMSRQSAAAKNEAKRL